MPMPLANEDLEADVPAPQFDVRKFYANIISFDEDQQVTELLGIEGA